MAIVKGNSLRIFSCKNEKVPIMAERANFRGLRYYKDLDSQTGLRSWRVRVEFEQSVPFSPPSDNVSSFDDNHDCYKIMIMGHYCFPLIVSHLLQEG